MTIEQTHEAGAAAVAGRPFPITGVNHLALVCRDMARTVAFYEGVLGLPLVKTIELPEGMGQHFFFDMGGGNLLAFFWFPGAPEPAPGVAAPAARPDKGDIVSAMGSMNHVALTVPADEIEACRERLLAAGVDCSVVVNHDDSEYGVSEEMHDGVFVRSIYFADPDGIMLELAAATRPFGPGDVRHEPARAVGAPGVPTTPRGRV
jgi:catechol 2,3-dioxygenase-like lactoylglutathione lyase family enzyme